MQNVYDIARDLTYSLKETDQYKDYARLKKQIDSDPRLKSMIDDFQAKSMQVQTLMMSGQNDQDLMDQVQSLSKIVMSDPMTARFVQAQMALSQIVGDIYNMIGEALNV